MNPPRSVRYVFIDGLRGLAALGVTLFHARAGHHVDAFAATWPGVLDAVVVHAETAVQVFFILSGFVIAHSMVRHDVTFGYVGRFLLRRSIRLDPPYWASMALTVGMGIVAVRFLPDKVFEPPTAYELLLHVFYLPDLLHARLINIVYWTLCMEIQFYLVFAAMMFIATQLRRWMAPEHAFCTVLIPALAVADLWPLRLQPVDVHGLFLGHWSLFMAGAAVYWTVSRAGDRFAALIAFANLAVLGVASAVFQDIRVAVGVVTALVILLANRREALGRWLGSKPFQLLGAASYSLYLIHNTVTGAMFRVGYKITGRSVALEALWLVLVVAGCIGLALLFWWAIERPSLALSRRIRQSEPPLPAPAIPAAPSAEKG